MKKNLTQGITDFKKFIDSNCYFVDKTHLIGCLIGDPSEVHLITRPRRFGKTLNLSMIRYFFEAQPPGGDSRDPPPNAPLFNGMSISKHPQCREYMGQYPVIHLSFKDAKASSHAECMEIIKDMLSAEYQRHEYLQDCEVLREIDKELFFKISNKKGNDQNCAQSIKHLSAWLKRAYNKPVYILLDEYDTPLHAAYTDNFYDEMIAFVRSFMAQSFKDNPNLKQAVVIGILKVAQESIFSDFNNPAVSTVLSDAMKDCFGFTEPEVEEMAAYLRAGVQTERHQGMVQRLHLRRRHGYLQSLESRELFQKHQGRTSALLGAHQCQQDGQGNAAAEQEGQPGKPWRGCLRERRSGGR